MTLHTSDGCTIANAAFTGTLTTSNCYNDAPGQAPNAGCDIQDPSTKSYGTGFNANKGGVFAMEWTSSAVSIWFFPRGTTPSNLQGGTPDPTSWPEPVARYQGTCNIPNHFTSMQIVRILFLLNLLRALSFLLRPSYDTSKSDINASTLRSSIRTFAETGPDKPGSLVPTAPPSPIPAMTTCRKTPLHSPMLTGRSTV